jgi:hypothetical protein
MPPPTLNAPGTWAAWANNAATLQSYVAAPDPPGTLMFQVQKPPGGATGDKVNIPACNGPKYVRLGYTITGEWTIDPLDVSNVVPIVGTQAATGKITPPAGAAAGLWTHTAVDWGGNEGKTKPSSWPADAINGQPGPGRGTRPQGTTYVVIPASTPAGLITWSTPVPGDSLVEYGTTTAYGLNKYDGTSVTAHSVQLTGLAAATQYHYRVSTLGAGFYAASTDFTFTTP